MKINIGDILVLKTSGEGMPVVDVDRDNDILFLFRKGETIKRALGQLMKVKRKYLIIRDGDTLSKDIAFYNPRTNEIVLLGKGSIYLGNI